MNFKQRFLRFGIGIGIGLLLSIAIFQGRGCSDWLPSQRVKSRIQMGGLRPGQEVMCVMNCWEANPLAHADISEKTLESLILEAEINWSASSPHDSPSRYILEWQPPSSLLSVECLLTDTASWILNPVLGVDDACGCL